MTWPDAAGGRFLGRSLLTVANVITVAAPVAADWNDSHIFNERWPGHARFHGVTALAMATSLSAVNIWSIWSDGSDPASARLYAATVPAAYWAPFFLALLVPGTAVDDQRRAAEAPGGPGLSRPIVAARRTDSTSRIPTRHPCGNLN